MAILCEVKRGAAAQIPVPYATERTAGWMIENAEAGVLKPSEITVENGVLRFALGEAALSLTDTIHSGWLHAGNGGNLMAMFEVQDGDFDLFTAASAVSTAFESDAVRVTRVSTPLCDRETGASLQGAKAHTDLYFWKALPLVSVVTYFEAARYTPVRSLALGRAAAAGSAKMTVDGRWKALSDSPAEANGGLLVCRDLREFDAAHPFVVHIAPDECELPVLAHEKRVWNGPVIESGDLVVQLQKQDGGLSLASITDKKGVALFDGAAPEPLFKLLLRSLENGSEDMLTSESGWDSVREEATQTGVAFRFEKPGLELELTAVKDEALSRVAWEIDVRLRDRGKTVVRLDPPAARMNAGDNVKIFFALGPGREIPVSARCELHSMSPYPSIGVCMEYLAIYDAQKRRGIYCGFHDPLASYKMLLADCHDGICKTEAVIPARGIDEAANGFHMDGQDVWQLFDGDWYDATVIFRGWVHACASWFTGVPASERRDVPEWLLKMPVWFQSNMASSEKWMENLFEAQDDLGGLPVGVHVYNWHEIPFDTNYPHYNPAKAEFVRKIPVMQAHGLKVMPYINGRLWDTHDRGDYDFQFTRVAKPAAAKGRCGTVITEHYESRNSKGEHVELAVMCPSTAIWQEKQMEINDWILNTLDADAVYVDQIAAAPPVTCMDRTHSHRRGGGSWWYEHYYNLIDHLNLRAAGKNKAYTTESNAEPFTGHIGGMLVWHWSGSHQVPAYPVVYAGYQPMLGRNYNAFKEDDTVGFRIMAAQSLCFGDQMGWINPERYLSSPYRAFFRSLAKLRWQYNEYFYAGRCLRPPKLEGDVGELNGPVFGSKGVLSALWQKNGDGSRIAILVNLTDGERAVKVSIDGAEPFEAVLAPVSAVVYPL